jgi:hypothetical protein
VRTGHTARSVERLTFLVAGGHDPDLLKPTVIFAKARPGVLWSAREARPNPLSGFLEIFRAI